jgi:hypothetical protein
MKTFGFFVCCGLLLSTNPLAAQENEAWTTRTFVTIDVPFQLLDNDFSESLSFPDALRRTEEVTFLAGYGSTRGPLFDVGAGVRVAGQLGVGATASWFQRSTAGSFDLKVPNPIAANRPLDLAGSITGLTRTELAMHIQALYALALGGKATLVLASGPSIFNMGQELVRSLEFDTLPGFASLRLNEALVTKVKETAVGFNVGANITWPLGSHFGVGTVTRYSRATLTFDPGAETGVRRAIEIRAGGLQIGGGIRLLF